jgi:CDGSH-type Zn-finger protein
VSGEIRVRHCPRGPLIVRGADAIVDRDGVAHEVTRPVVAVCVCDRSSRMPWCDATHKSIRSDPR